MAATGRTLGNVDGPNVRDWANDYAAVLSSRGGAFNLSLAYSVAASALTIAAKQQGGADAVADLPIVAAIRSAAAASGDFNVRTAAAALSLVVSSGSTLGHGNSDSRWTYVYLIDNAGALELAVSSKCFGAQGIVSTTAEGGAGGADSATVMYSTTARANVPFLCVGRFQAPQTTAGTWAAVPTSAQMLPFVAVGDGDDLLMRNATISGTLAVTGAATFSSTLKGASTISVGNATPSASGAGITFPAAQSASTDANTLDDYEEGTWTIGVGGTATYNWQTGWYIKTGRDVHVTGSLSINAIGTGSTSRMSGLPFSQSNGVGTGVAQEWSGLATNMIDVNLFTGGGADEIRNSGRTTAGTASSVDNAIFGNGTRLDFGLQYMATA